VIRVDGDEAVLEFDSYTPLEAKLVYESGGAGRSVSHFYGVAIMTAYSIENGAEFPWPVSDAIARDMRIQQRMEFISKDRWMVWLDNVLTQVSPFGDVWMPSDDGTNPYGFNPAVLINGLETDEDVLGQSDIHHSIYDAQDVNEIWSDVIYAQRMYVPVHVLKTKNPNIQAQFTGGIGAGLAIDQDDSFEIVTAEGLSFQDMMVPLLTQLELTLANAHLPGVALGLDRVYARGGGGGDVASGKAKELDWGPVVAHAEAKRKPFSRGIRQLVRSALRMASFDRAILVGGVSKRLGLAKGNINPDARPTIEYSDEIIPLSKAEELDRLVNEVLNGMRSVGSAMKVYNDWTDERVAQEMDTIRAEKKLSFVDLPYDQIAEAIAGRQGQPVDKAASEKLFEPMPGFQSDKLSGGGNQNQGNQ